MDHLRSWARSRRTRSPQRPWRPRPYLAIRYYERQAEAGVFDSVGSKGDNHDNALADGQRLLQDRTHPSSEALAFACCSLPLPIGCPGGTSDAFRSPAETSLRQSSKRHNIANYKLPSRPESREPMTPRIPGRTAQAFINQVIEPQCVWICRG